MTTTWNKVNKATGTSWTKVANPSGSNISAGQSIGLLLALTYATATGGIWTKISKATSTSWNKVTKAT